MHRPFCSVRLAVNPSDGQANWTVYIRLSVAEESTAESPEPEEGTSPSAQTQLKMAALIIIAAYILSDGKVLTQFGLTSDPTTPDPDPQPEHWPAEWHGTQVVCVHWPAAIWPTDVVPLPEMHRNTAGELLNDTATSEPGTAIECVGGITNASTVEEATRRAGEAAGWSVESHDEYLGIIIDDIRAHGIAAPEAGEAREWEFWHGESIGEQSVDQARMASESWIVWRVVSH